MSRAKVFVFFGFVISVSYWSESLGFKRLFSDMLQFMEGTHLGYNFIMCLGTYGWKVARGCYTWCLSLKIVRHLQIPGQVPLSQSPRGPGRLTGALGGYVHRWEEDQTLQTRWSQTPSTLTRGCVPTRHT